MILQFDFFCPQLTIYSLVPVPIMRALWIIINFFQKKFDHFKGGIINLIFVCHFALYIR
jgi:hypothetical protein